MSDVKQQPAVCDYEGSGYRTEFWEGQGRDYEDQTERVALARLLPSTGRRLLEIGAGFGRLTNEFSGYDQVILLDYSSTLLQEARELHGDSDRFVYVAADIYNSPINDGVCDAATMIRVIHHMQNAPDALQQVRRALAPGATFILEFANKRNFKAMLRHALRQQDYSPYTHEPVEFVELNFNFHPHYIYDALETVGFETQQRLALSYLRIGLFKRIVPTGVLVSLDSILQWSGALFNVSPSVFTKNVAVGDGEDNLNGDLFKCPRCTSVAMTEHDDYVECGGCDARWSKANGIYNFKEPMD